MHTEIKIFTIIFSLLMSVVCFGNPYLIAEPIENLTDYYVVSVNGEEITTPPALDELLMYDLKNMEDGEHMVIIRPGNFEMGDGVGVLFYIEKKTDPDYIHYTIKKDPVSLKDDPDYEFRFDSPLYVKVENNDNNNPPDDDTDGGSGGGGGCFISSII